MYTKGKKDIVTFAKSIVNVEETAKNWGRMTQKDIDTFVKNWVKSFNDALCQHASEAKKHIGFPK